jgi:hypothetical protein
VNEQQVARPTDSRAESSHTPGPWKADGLTVESITHGNICLVNLARPKGPTEANLRLIAAAPDLLAALRKIVSDGDFTAPEGMKRIACDAIAKAEGRS